MYSEKELIEILRYVIFEGTPELYDNGGVNCNIVPVDTTKRAKDAFEKYYIKKRQTT